MAYVALAAATVGAFFVTQHLKVSTPLIAGFPKPTPGVISPDGTGCGGSYRVARFSFYLLNRADDVAVYVVGPSGIIVRTLASGRPMRREVRTQFPWDGHEDDGRVAPDGMYVFRVALLRQNRTVDYTRVPVTVLSSPPHPVITAVAPAHVRQGGTPVQIRYSGNEQRAVTVRIYRIGRRDSARLVKSFHAGWRGATWDGRVRRRPAPAGRYLIGLEVQDRACNVGRFPPRLPPSEGSVAQAEVTVS